MPDARPGVAIRLHGLLRQLFGAVPDLRVLAWDGSQAGGPDQPVLRLNSRKAVRRLLWTPGARGVAQAYVTGQIDVDGDFAHAVRILLDYLDTVSAAEPIGPGGRKEILRFAVVSGAVGPASAPPAVALGGVDGYAPVDAEMADRLSAELATRVVGDAGTATGWLRSDGVPPTGQPDRIQRRFVAGPEPLSAALRRWEDERIDILEIRRIDDAHNATLSDWTTGLERNWDQVCGEVGLVQARAWRLNLALNTEHLRRGTVKVYQVCGVCSPE